MKKILLVVILVVLASIALYATIEQNNVTVTTTADYAVAKKFEIGDMENSTIFIKNTGSNSMKLKVYVYASSSGTIYEEYISEISVAASSSIEININDNIYSRMEIYVKNDAGATTCVIDWIMRKTY